MSAAGRPLLEDTPLTKPRLLALDVQYAGERAYVGAYLATLFGDALEDPREFSAEAETPGDYEPGEFVKREGPLLVAMARAIPAPFDLLILDAHGLAHPKRLGLACHVGLALDVPTVGIAKEPLVRFTGELDDERGSRLPVLVEGKRVGWVVRTQDGVRPMFASPGHRCSVDGALAWALRLPSQYRVSEPQRAADRLCRARSRGEPAGEDLGELAR